MNYCSASPTKDDCKKYTEPDAARRAPAEDRTRLYVLSFLLTPDRAKAEQCAVAGLDLSAEDNEAFRDWAHSWARHIVINSARRLVAPCPERKGYHSDYGGSR